MWVCNYIFLDIMDNKNEKIFSRNRIKLPNLDKFYAKKNVRKILKIIIILLIAIIIFKVSINSITPIIDERCKGIAKSVATKISNEQATKVMENYKYEDFCSIIKDENDNIKMISTNMITINKVISDIPILIQEELEKSDENTFNIKLR